LGSMKTEIFLKKGIDKLETYFGFSECDLPVGPPELAARRVFTSAYPSNTKTIAGVTTCSRYWPSSIYLGYLNSGAAFSASLLVFIDASHLSFLLS
jgi:hypothetical protein